MGTMAGGGVGVKALACTLVLLGLCCCISIRFHKIASHPDGIVRMRET
jgi:hypothetical protein